MINKIKLAWWRSVLRRRYIAYQNIAGEYNCGSRLAEYMSCRLSDAKERFNKAVRAVNRLDPNAKLEEWT